jgi:hypothetical protein
MLISNNSIGFNYANNGPFIYVQSVDPIKQSTIKIEK